MEEEISQETTPAILPPTKSQSFWELARFAIIALLIVIPIRMFVAEPFIVSGSSMSSTFTDRDYLIVDKISYELGSPKRDDVVIFRYPKDTKKFFIKRIVGLPNETVDIKEQGVMITNNQHPEGFMLAEPYLKKGFDTSVPVNFKHLELRSDEYYVMGDNRNASSDSRFWGPVVKNLLVGRAALRLLPVGAMEFWPGNYKQK